MWAFFLGALVFAIGVLFGYGIAVAMMHAILDSDYSND